MECGELSRDRLSQGSIKSQAKKCGCLAALREGYKALISRKEVCISRVAYSLSIKINRWNVANCRVTACRSL